MRRIRVTGMLMLVVIALFVLGGAAYAAPFYWPPEDYAPRWSTSFPYQRNVDWTFDTNPEGGPTPSGAPGAHYEGLLDPLLWDSDFVEFTGDVEWYEELLYEGVWKTGLIGIDNRQGAEALTGMAIFHLDNTPELYNKNLYLEIDNSWPPGPVGGPGMLSMYVDLPEGSSFDVEAVMARTLYGGYVSYGMYYHIVPNPLWEEFELTFTVPAGEMMVVDRLHIATECVPEPGTLCLLGLGVAAVGLYRRKRA